MRPCTRAVSPYAKSTGSTHRGATWPGFAERNQRSATGSIQRTERGGGPSPAIALLPRAPRGAGEAVSRLVRLRGYPSLDSRPRARLRVPSKGTPRGIPAELEVLARRPHSDTRDSSPSASAAARPPLPREAVRTRCRGFSNSPVGDRDTSGPRTLPSRRHVVFHLRTSVFGIALLTNGVPLPREPPPEIEKVIHSWRGPANPNRGSRIRGRGASGLVSPKGQRRASCADLRRVRKPD